MDQYTHADPVWAARFGLFCVMLAAQNRIVFGRTSGVRLAVPHATLRVELRRMLAAYLSSSPAADT